MHSAVSSAVKKINIKTLTLLAIAFLVGWYIGHQDVSAKWQNYRPIIKVENKEPPKEITVDFKLFWDTWDFVTKTYLDKSAIDQQKMFYGAISGMVAALGDPYTVFLPPEQQKISKEELNGSFEGVGIQLGFNKEKRLVVIAPLDGTPAQKAGIRASDIIIEIESEDTTGISLPEAVKRIRGEKGTQVSLTIFREGEEETRTFKLVRDTIVVKSVTLKMEKTSSGKDVALIKLSRFGERTNDEWMAAVSEALSNSPEAVILDLRNNPGGLLDGAVFIASEFLASGDVVLSEDSQGRRSSYKVNREGKLTKIQLVVLINKGSASASEIVAGALQDRKRAKLVGTKSFGKGTIQEAEQLPGGTGIHITTAKWLTPDGKWVNETEGLTPDEILEDEQKDDEVDEQLKKALEILN